MAAADRRKRKRRLAKVLTLASSTDIICLQETHIVENTTYSFDFRLSKTHECWHSTAGPGGAGGGSVLIIKKIASEEAERSSEIIEMNRVLRVEVKTKGCVVITYACHNFATPAARWSEICRRMHEALSFAAECPKKLSLIHIRRCRRAI